MDGTLLVEGDASIEGSGSAEKIQGSFTIVTLTSAVNVGLGQDNQAGAVLVPLQLDLVTFEECLLRDGAVEERDVEDLDSSRLALGRCYLRGQTRTRTTCKLTLRSGIKTATAWFWLPGARA